MKLSDFEVVQVIHTCGHMGLYWVNLTGRLKEDFVSEMEVRPCREQCPERPRVRHIIERLFGRPEV